MNINAGISETLTSINDIMQFTTDQPIFLLPSALLRFASHIIRANIERTAITANAPKKRHLKFVVGTRIIPRSKTSSAVLIKALFFSQAAFSLNFVQVSTTNAISAATNKPKNNVPISIQPFFMLWAYYNIILFFCLYILLQDA